MVYNGEIFNFKAVKAKLKPAGTSSAIIATRRSLSTRTRSLRRCPSIFAACLPRDLRFPNKQVVVPWARPAGHRRCTYIETAGGRLLFASRSSRSWENSNISRVCELV